MLLFPVKDTMTCNDDMLNSNTSGRMPDISSSEEIFEVCDPEGRVTGLASRPEVHSDPSLIHRVVHVLVFDSRGCLLLQKRSMNKDICAGKWDTSVGGHVQPGEDLYEAAVREMQEELGITPAELQPLYSYLHSNHRESELVTTFSCVCDGHMHFNTEEIDEVRYWPLQSIRQHIGAGIFSVYFEDEFSNYLRHSKKQ